MIGISPNLSEDNFKVAEQNWNVLASTERKLALEKRFQELPDEKLAKYPPSERFVKWYTRRDPQAWHDFHFDSSPLWKDVHPNIPMFDFLYGVALRDLDITKGLKNFDKPVFLALGRYDFIVAPPTAWEPILPSFKNITVKIFEKSGHSPQYEEAVFFDEILLNWISKS